MDRGTEKGTGYFSIPLIVVWLLGTEKGTGYFSIPLIVVWLLEK
jgi:hypothetical protein